MDDSKEKIQVEVKTTTAETLRQTAQKNGLSKGEVIDQLITQKLDNDPWNAAMLATANFKVLTSKLSQEDFKQAALYAVMDLVRILQNSAATTEYEKKMGQFLEIAAKKAAEYKEQEENA